MVMGSEPPFAGTYSVSLDLVSGVVRRTFFMPSTRMAAALQALNPLADDGTDGELLQRFMAGRDSLTPLGRPRGERGSE